MYSKINMKFLKYFLINKRVLLLFFILLIGDVFISSHDFFNALRLFFFWDISGQVKHILYLINYIIQIVFIVLLLISKNRILQKIAYIFLYITLIIFLTYYLINGYGFTSSEAMVAISDFSFAKEAFNNFSTSIYTAIGISSIIIMIIYLVGKPVKNNINTFFLMTSFFILLILYVINGTRTASNRLFFIPYKVIFNFYNAYNTPMYLGKKEVVTRKVGSSKIDKIVYVVDESIVGTRLSLNGFKKNTTPFLKSVEEKIYNYGVASSCANCSAISNTILRSCANSSMFPDKEQCTLKNANIWAYAKKAGYYTVFIDAQNIKSKPQNFMTKYDFLTIDKYIQIQKNTKVESYKNDFKIINFLKLELNKHKKVFIYINKYGAHFPYEDRYPQEEKFFTPTLDIGEAPSLQFKNKMLNSYYNAVRWSVDLWWKKIFKSFGNINVLFFYTSDHGQNLFDNSSRVTHCSVNPISKEADVPLFLVPFGNTKLIIDDYIKKNLVRNFNSTSHFNIYPTILFLEGYELQETEKSLFQDLSNQDRFFYSGDIWGKINYKKNKFK